MMSSEPIGVGVIGMGFMGTTHVAAYRSAAEAGFDNRLVAVCDADPARLTGQADGAGNIETGSDRLFDPAAVRTYTEPEQLLADPDVRLVSICTYTDTHPALAIAALAAGKHVLVEKPLAVDPEDARRVASAAADAKTLCMPAMCMRFWPGWTWLKERIDDGSLGKVRSAVFQRLGAKPGWGEDFYLNPDRSGGALVDLHVHDADFIRWCFGPPASVVSTGSVHHVTTLYKFPDGPEHVIAEGGWDHDAGVGFRMRFMVIFDRATAEFDLSREHPLTVSQRGETRPIELEPIAGYDGEVRHVLSAIAEGRTELRATADEAVGVMRVIAGERTSLETGQVVGF